MTKTEAADYIAICGRQISREYNVEVTDDLLDRIVALGFSADCPRPALSEAVRAYPARRTIRAAL